MPVWFRDFAATEGVDGGFVQAHHGAERTGDEMQFVLNDQVRRKERFGQRLPGGVGVTRAIEAAIFWIAVGALNLAEQLACLALPGQAGKLIDRRD